MDKHDIVVIGASAGGVHALKELVSELPADFDATIFIVQHISPDSPSYLPDILNFKSRLKAVHAKDGEPIRPGTIYIAPPDHHMLVEKETVLVKKGPKENRFRPSIDALFRSAAYTFGTRVIGIILTGLLNDGTSGMWSVKRLGGVCVIQQPEEALYPSMPESVREYVDVDYTVSIAQLSSLLVELTRREAAEKPLLSPDEDARMAKEITIAKENETQAMELFKEGALTPLTCPECHGSLVSIQEGGLIRYRCHTGHGFTSGSLMAGVTHSIEESLWNALRSLEELIMLLDKTAEGLEHKGDVAAARPYRDRADQAQERINCIRPMLFE
jgi:two-component system chemotaxis response regulator CheB